MGNLILLIMSFFCGITLHSIPLNYCTQDKNISVQEIPSDAFVPNNYINSYTETKTVWLEATVPYDSHGRIFCFYPEPFYKAEVFAQNPDGAWILIGKTGSGMRKNDKKVKTWINAVSTYTNKKLLHSETITYRIRIESYKNSLIGIYDMSYNDFLSFSVLSSKLLFSMITTIFATVIFIILSSINFKDYDAIFMSILCLLLGIDVLIVSGLLDYYTGFIISVPKKLFKLSYFTNCGAILSLIYTMIRVYSPILNKHEKWNNLSRNIFPITGIFIISTGFFYLCIPQTNNTVDFVFMFLGMTTSIVLAIVTILFSIKHNPGANRIIHTIWITAFGIILVEQILLYIRFIPGIKSISHIYDNDFGFVDILTFFLISISVVYRMFIRIRSKFAKLQIISENNQKQVIKDIKQNFVYSNLSAMLANPMQIFHSKVEKARNVIPHYDYLNLLQNLTYSEEIIRTLFLLSEYERDFSILKHEQEPVDLHLVIKEATFGELENLRTIGCYPDLSEQITPGICVSANKNLLTVLLRYTIESITKQVEPHSTVSINASYENYSFTFSIEFSSKPLSPAESAIVLDLKHFEQDQNSPEFSEGEEIIKQWGIYLYLVKRIVSLFKGKISIIPGLSSNNIKINLALEPLPITSMLEFNSENEDEDNPELSIYKNPNPRAVCAYILEENSSVRRSLIDRFKDNYTVYSFSNSYDFTQKFMTNVPAIIICSLTIPGINAFELLKEYSQKYIIPFFVTAKAASKKTIDNIFNFGATDVFIKPFSLDYVYSKVNAVTTSHIRYADMVSKNMEKTLRESIFNMDVKLSPATDENNENLVIQEKKDTIEDLSKSSMNALFTSANLTKKETEIATLIIEGKSDKEIATILNISTGTVAVHNKKIYKKLDVHSRSQLIEKIQ